MSTLSTETLGTPIALPARFPAALKAMRSIAGLFGGIFAPPMAASGDPARLYRLNDHVMRDIGVSRADIGPGPADSFWRG